MESKFTFENEQYITVIISSEFVTDGFYDSKYVVSFEVINYKNNIEKDNFVSSETHFTPFILSKKYIASENDKWETLPEEIKDLILAEIEKRKERKQ